MNTLNFLIFALLGIANYWIYHYFFSRFNKGQQNYEARQEQPIGPITRFIRYFQNYYAPMALVYFFARCFILEGIEFKFLNIMVGSSLAAAGVALMAWALSHLKNNFSPCHAAKIPENRVKTGPYQYVSHPIYAANFMQFLGITIANPDAFFISAICIQAFFYIFAMKDENKALEKQFGRPPKFINTVLVFMALVIMLFSNFIFPFLLTENDLINHLLMIFLGATSFFIWSVIHEGIHNHLFYEIKHNNFWSRMLGVCFGSAFIPTKLGHLSHHKYSRTKVERFEIYKDKSDISSKLYYYFVLFGGFYLGELLLPFIALLPINILKKIDLKMSTSESIGSIVFRKFVKIKKNISSTRFDVVLICLYLALSVCLFQGHLSLLIAFYITRALIVSLLDYSYHYNTKLDDISYAKNLKLPRLLEIGYLNFNLHGVHHKFPEKKWYELKQNFNGKYSDSLVSACLMQLRGPLSSGDISDE